MDVYLKSMVLHGRMASIADKYDYGTTSNEPDSNDVNNSFAHIEDYLKKHAKSIVATTIKHLPLADMGVISQAKASSCYSWRDCLIFNRISPTVFNGIYHTLFVAGPKKSVVNSLLEELSEQSNIHCWKYWQSSSFKAYNTIEYVKGLLGDASE